MKKIFAIVLAMAFVLAMLAGCGKTPASTTDSTTAVSPDATKATEPASTTAEEVKTDPNEKSEGVMTYTQYAQTEKDAPVVIEGFIQAKQIYSSACGNTSLYLADGEGAYFVYRYTCTADEYEALKVGMKVKVEGYKSEWAEEPEITDAKITVEEGTYVADPVDFTSLLGTNLLADHKNQYGTFKGGVVCGMGDGRTAYYYNYNGTGSEGNDLYFNVEFGGVVYTFTVESDLCGAETEVYKVVKSLHVGDTIDITGFLYWYNGLNAHTTRVDIKECVAVKDDDVMSYEEYEAAETDTEVIIEAYIQAKQKYSEDYGNTSLYLQDQDGAYFVYLVACTQEEYDRWIVGSRVKVTGYKSEWAGEAEITDATVETKAGTYYAAAVDVTSKLGLELLESYMNQFVTVKGAEVVAMDSLGAAYYYGWNGTGSEGDDLYFKISVDGQEYSFVVESDLCGSDTEVYKTVKSLKVGNIIDIEAFLYWYNGANPHTTKVTIVTR